MTKGLTGKQQKFVTEYLNGANFNSTLAAKNAGYRATSQHSFESIGSELLSKPLVKAAVDEYFRQANVSAEEVLRELGQLARGSSKDKIRALSLLAAHHGLLDGSYWSRGGKENIEIIVKYETDKLLNNYVDEVQKELDELNRKKDAQWVEIRERYKDHPIAVEALDLLFKTIRQTDDTQLEREQGIARYVPTPEPEYQIVQSP